MLGGPGLRLGRGQGGLWEEAEAVEGVDGWAESRGDTRRGGGGGPGSRAWRRWTGLRREEQRGDPFAAAAGPD